MSDVTPKISAEEGNSSSKVFDTDNAGMQSQSAVHGSSDKPVPVASMSPRVTRSRSQAMPPPPSLPVKRTMSTSSSSIGSANDHLKLAGQEKGFKMEKTLKRIKTTPSEALGAEEVKSLLRDVEPPVGLQLITQDNLADFIASAYGHNAKHEKYGRIPSLRSEEAGHSNVDDERDETSERMKRQHQSIDL
ncbi:hypothetical protein QAD02_012363 [Eretmocerus hayati]|uniref:Uncharacterized protein n=1 Tax=Eretmocerus hayati TaxID=131215 RepID=A0ACC2P0H6_9HYME|nr:hypothetical protein QAD02_012363 [Eretmocerus hayati]